MAARREEPGYVPHVPYEDVTEYEPYPDVQSYEIQDPQQGVEVRYRTDHRTQTQTPSVPQATRTMLRNLTAFHGRLDRPTFWLGTLGLVGGVAAATIVMMTLTLMVLAVLGSSAAGVVGAVGGGALLIGVLAGLLALVSGGVRRLHDTGLPGWLLLLWFVPFGWVAVTALLARGGQRQTNLYGRSPDAR